MVKESINKTEILQKIMPVVEQAAEENGLLTVEVNFVKEAGKWTLKIFIYNPQKPVTHEDCENITKKVDPVLDELISVPYRLEVSSPGTERKLKSEKEYEIFKGKRVKIKKKKTAESETKTFLAWIRKYTPEEGLTADLPDEEGEIKIKQENISYVKLEPEYKFKN